MSEIEVEDKDERDSDDSSNRPKIEDEEGEDFRIIRGIASARRLVAWVLVGKFGPAYMIAPVIFLFAIHVMEFAFGIKYSMNCYEKPLLPVSMVMIGGDGALKSLSYLIQLVITIQSKMKRLDAFFFMSESSVLDSGLSLLYIVSVLIGSVSVFVGEMSSCQTAIFEVHFYYTIVALTLIIISVVLMIWKFIQPNDPSDFIDKNNRLV